VKPGRLDVGVVGAGRVGAVWGAALAGAGHHVVAASGVSETSVSRIETLLPGVPRMEPEEVVRAADLVVLTVPDDALAPLVSGLGAVGAWRRGQIAVHASGRHGLAVMAPAEEAGVACLAIHPALTFTGTSLDLVRMREAVFAITARPTYVPIAQALVVEFGGEAVILAEDARPLYHAALVHGANHVVTTVAQAMVLLADAGIEDPGRLLGPLVRASIEGVLPEVPGDLASLTGPVVRGDVGTLAAHLAALQPHPQVRETYVALARATASLARTAGRLSEAAYAGVMDLLGAP
jgi:predicted short-subunit dehydrogenase-like oxidoreductase (DUF2520 family)